MSSSLHWLIPVVLMGALLDACGGKSFDRGNESEAGSDSGGSTLAGTGSGGSSAGESHGGTSSGGKSNGGTSSGGAATQCDPADYQDAMGGSVPVLIINETSKPIYLGQETLGCAAGPSFQVADAAGQALATPGFCQPTCHMMLTHTVIGCPAIACAIGGVTVLQPGESASSQWSALYTQSVKLPPACQAVAGAAECTRIADVEPGTYYFSAKAGSNMQCGTGADAASCSACMPTGTGGCMVYGAVITPPLLQAKVEVKLDGSYGIGGPGGGGMVRAVEIVFKD